MPPTKKTIGLREVRVGLLVIISVVILIFLILNASGDISFSRKLHVRTRFLTADGLRPGAEVRLAGVRIGKVDNVRLLPATTNPNEKRIEAVLSKRRPCNAQLSAGIIPPTWPGTFLVADIAASCALIEPTRQAIEEP